MKTLSPEAKRPEIPVLEFENKMADSDTCSRKYRQMIIMHFHFQTNIRLLPSSFKPMGTILTYDKYFYMPEITIIVFGLEKCITGKLKLILIEEGTQFIVIRVPPAGLKLENITLNSFFIFSFTLAIPFPLIRHYCIRFIDPREKTFSLSSISPTWQQTAPLLVLSTSSPCFSRFQSSEQEHGLQTNQTTLA